MDLRGGIRYSPDPLAEVPERLFPLRRAVVEAVRQPPGSCADGGDVPHGLRDGVHRAPIGVDPVVAGIAVRFQGHAIRRARQRRHQSRIRLSRVDDGVAHDSGVVMPVAGHLRRDIGVPQDFQGNPVVVGRLFENGFFEVPFRLPFLPLVPYPLGDHPDGRVADHFPILPQDIILIPGDGADDGCPGPFGDARQLEVLIVYPEDSGGEAFGGDPAHPLLGLGAGDDVRRQPLHACVDLVQADVRAVAGGSAHLGSRAHDASRPKVLVSQSDFFLSCCLKDLVARADDDVLEEGVRDLHRSAVGLALFLVKDERGEGRAAEAGIVRGLSHEDDVVANGVPWRIAVDDVLLPDNAQADHIDQAVLVEGPVEIDVAADVGDADGVSVSRDAVHHLAGNVPDLVPALAVRVPEPQVIGNREHLGAHAEHVPDVPSHAGGRAFIGNDLAGVVVALVGNDDSPPLAVNLPQLDDAGILLRPEDDIGGGGGQHLQHAPRALVGGMLAPLGVEDVQLGEGRIALQELGHFPRFLFLEGKAVLPQEGAERGVIHRRNRNKLGIDSTHTPPPF